MKNGPYILIKAPDEYPGKKYRGRYVYEHRLVWWKNTNIIPPNGYQIHHKNEIKTDNRFENLELISTQSHNIVHSKGRSTKLLICDWCKSPFIRQICDYNTKIKLGQKRFYCCRSHQVRDQQRIRKNISE